MTDLDDPELKALLEKTAREYIAKKQTASEYPKLVYKGAPSNVWEVLCPSCGKTFESNSPRNRNCAECMGLPTFGSTYVPPLDIKGKEAGFSQKEPGTETKKKE